MKKRILIVPDAFPWILGTWAKEIYKWNNRRYEFYFISSKAALRDRAAFQALVGHVDLVHILTPHCLSLLSEIIDPQKTVSSVHHVVEWKADFDLAVRCRRIMVVSSEWRTYLCERGVDPRKITLLYNGIDPGTFSQLPRPERLAVRSCFGIRETDFVIGTFSKRSSNQNDRKGIETLLAAFAQLRAMMPEKAIKLLVTGPGWDDLNEQLRGSMIYRPFLPQAEMCGAYNALDAYFVSSTIEGGPAPLIEAMACGVAVITTPVGMARDMISHGDNGLLIPKNAPTEAASALAELIANSEHRNSIAASGRSHVLDNFTWQKTVGNIAELYEPALENGVRERSKRFWRTISRKNPYIPHQQRADAVMADYRDWADDLRQAGHSMYADMVVQEPAGAFLP